jgi:hypothetical protein
VKKRRIVSIALLAAIAAVAAVLLFAIAPSTATKTVRPGLTLLVNQRTQTEILPGTPLLFDVSLGSSPSSAPFDVGDRWRPWHSLVRLEQVPTEQTVPWTLVRVGPPRSIHFVRDNDGQPALTEDSSSAARLEAGRHVHTVTFAAAPNDTGRIKPGTYRVRGVVETPSWMYWGWKGRVASAAVAIVVRDPSSSDRREQLDAERLALAAKFFLTAGRFEEARQAAVSLVTMNPLDSRSHILLGDASAGLNRLEEALDAYQRAMALLPRSYEEPRLLIDRIRGVVHAMQP